MMMILMATFEVWQIAAADKSKGWSWRRAYELEKILFGGSGYQEAKKQHCWSKSFAYIINTKEYNATM